MLKTSCKCNVSLIFSKLQFKLSSIDLYGLTLVERKIQPVAVNLDEICNLKTPSNVKDLQTNLRNGYIANLILTEASLNDFTSL